MTNWAYPLVVLAIAQAGAAQASEAVLYGAAPAWVTRASLPDVSKQGAEAPALILFDSQQKIDGDTLTVFLDTASRAATPELVSQMANLTLPWLPDKGNLTVHELSILRGAERIDLLAKGQKFTVLRREETMEQRELTGQLTASLPVEGLQTGDILRLAYSVSMKDPALAGYVQNVVPVPAEPVRIAAGSMRVLWDKGREPHWKLLSGAAAPRSSVKGAFGELLIAIPAAKLAEVPNDAPTRLKPLPVLEISTFSSWEEVSRVMAPLYATDGLIPAGSPLAAEVSAIMRADPTPIGRAQRALRLVQDQIRYLAVFMDGGNYVPQKPARTWELRYGDCKAKSLLLLALLREMGIEAEPVLASSQLGDWAPQRLPSAAAFDHVLIRATIDGKTAWLDGTRTGSRLPDFWDTPSLRNVLPVRTAGATLMPVALRNNARPTIDIDIDADESASVDLPSAFTITAVFRGDLAGKIALANQLTAEQRRDGARAIFTPFIGEAQLADIVYSYDDEAGAATVKARAAVTTPWRMVDRRLRRDSLKLLSSLDFSADRGRPAWASMPVATDGPMAMHWRMKVRLPEGGRGFTLDGDRNVTLRAASHELTRTMSIVGDILSVDERVDETGQEIAAADIGRERDALAAAKARAPKLVAPADTRRYWNLAGKEPAGATQVTALEDVFAKAIAADKDSAEGYVSRANFRRGIGNNAGAITDYGKALALAPTAELYVTRAWVQQANGDLKAALADAEAARKLDPSSIDANRAAAQLRAENGDLPGALTLLEERESVGGEARAQYRRARADVLGEFGDAAEAIHILDAQIDAKPGSPSLLNARCWVKGTRSMMLDSALKDCTSAVELAESSSAALDSRAMVWFRMGRYDDALRDLDAALAQAPGRAASLYMRGVVLGKLNRAEEGGKDLALARRVYPRIDVEYARYGVKP